jgi:hypothetical protein
LAAAEYKTDVIDGMEWNGMESLFICYYPVLTFQFFVISIETRKSLQINFV